MSFNLSSTIAFKNSFLKNNSNFSENTIIQSFDCVKLYPSVNVEFTIDKIIKIIYKDKKSSNFYFSDNLDDQNKQKTIPKTKFRKFLQQVLLDFTCFSTPIGYYKQVFGLGMGSPISGLIANLYLNFIEEIVIKPKIETKE